MLNIHRISAIHVESYSNGWIDLKFVNAYKSLGDPHITLCLCFYKEDEGKVECLRSLISQLQETLDATEAAISAAAT